MRLYCDRKFLVAFITFKKSLSDDFRQNNFQKSKNFRPKKGQFWPERRFTGCSDVQAVVFTAKAVQILPININVSYETFKSVWAHRFAAVITHILQCRTQRYYSMQYMQYLINAYIDNGNSANMRDLVYKF